MFDNDSFLEQVVKNGKPNKYYYLKILLSLLVILTGWVIILFSNPGIMSIMVAPVIIIGGIFLFFCVLGYRRMEFEYTFTNGSVEIAGVYKASKRREFFHFDFDQVLMIAPVNSKRLENEKFDRKSYFGSVKGNDQQIAMLVDIKKKKELIIIEPNEKTMKHILLFAKNKCYDL